MPVFQPDEVVVRRIVRVIEDVFQLGPDPTDFVELSDSIEFTTDVVPTMDNETTVTGEPTAAVDTATAMEWTSTADHARQGSGSTATGHQTVTILDPGQSPLTYKQESKLIVKRLFAMECNQLQNYLMVILKRSSIKKTIRLMSGWILNHHLKYYYEAIEISVIAFLRMECIALIEDNSPRVRDCSYSIIMSLAEKNLYKWTGFWLAVTEMLDSEDHCKNKVALDMLLMVSKKHSLGNLPNNSIDKLIPKIVKLFGSTDLTKRTLSVSIVNEFIVQKLPCMLNHITLLFEKLLVSDKKKIQNVNEENNKTILRRSVCKSIITLVQKRPLTINDNIRQIVLYMINRTKDKDKKTVEEVCKFWITISKEQSKKYRVVVFPYLHDIISSLTDKLLYTQKDLISIKKDHASKDYPFFINTDSIRKHCVAAIESMVFAFKDDILQGVIQMINKKVSAKDLKIQEVAIVLMGCFAISRGCREAITPYLEIPFKKLILFNNYFIPGESIIRDKLLWTLVAYRDYLVNQPQFLKPMMKYMLRSEIKSPLDYPLLEGDAFWNLVTDKHLAKEAFRQYFPRVLSIVYDGLYYYERTFNEVVKHDKSGDRCTRNDSTDALSNLICIYKNDILPIITPMIDKSFQSDDPKLKESAIIALELLSKGGIGNMVTNLSQYLSFMVDLLTDFNPRLSSASGLTLSHYHDWIINRERHINYIIPLMLYLLSTETEYTSIDPHTLTCVLLSIDVLLHDNPRAKNLFAPYLSRVIPNIFKATVYSDADIIELQDDAEEDSNFRDSPMIICKQFISSLRDDRDNESPRYKCSSISQNRGKAADILQYLTTMFNFKVIPIILPLIQVALKSDNWRIMESGIYTLGIINRDEDVYNAFKNPKWFPYYQEFLKCMMDNLSNEIPIVRANTMVTLSHFSYFVINRTRKKRLIPLMRMITAEVVDSNQNVRATALQVWNCLRNEVTEDEPIIKLYMDHIWAGLLDSIESYQRLLRGQNGNLRSLLSSYNDNQ